MLVLVLLAKTGIYLSNNVNHQKERIMIMFSLKKLLDPSNKALKQAEKIADKILAKDEEFQALSDNDLKAKTEEFKSRLKNGETLDDILIEAYATVREAAFRVLGMKPFKVQVMGAIILHGGNISEMRTGEGKTLTSTMPAYLNALTEKGVHIITVNEYLAQRDAEEMGQVFKWLGLSVGLNLTGLSQFDKKQQYLCDITYTTNNELGFDYLRDHMVRETSDICQRPLNFAIIDEVDSILIDEARTPLIISGGEKRISELYVRANLFVQQLKANKDYDLDIKTKNVQLNESGMEKAEKFFNVTNLYDLEHTLLLHHINNALKANYIMARDVDYLVQEGEIIIVDPFTGRLMKGRAYSEGLHQAIQAKEHVQIKEETQTLATITFQNLFRLYNKLSGMTGTAKTEEEEFRNIYNMMVVEVPTNRPIQRIDEPDLIYKSFEDKIQAVVEDVANRHEKGQPVLLGTIAVETSELISKYLKKRRIPHNVLNAKNHAYEAEIIMKAGEKGAVTIATNMAGRGTDIKLTDEVKALGGLAVIGTERHESRRIDNQLRGRSGRQGDPGYTRFYLSFEDDLLRRFGSDRMIDMVEKLGMESTEAIESKMITKAVEGAQQRVEGNNYDMRKTLLQYDDVIRAQRERIYAQRQTILEMENVEEIVIGMFETVTEQLIEQTFSEEAIFSPNDLLVYLNQNFFNLTPLPDGLFDNETEEKAKEMLLGNFKDQYSRRKKEIGPIIFNHFEKTTVLQVIDRHWINHIDMMDALRQGIHLRSYGQINPLHEYQSEGFEMFQQLVIRIGEDVIRHLFRTKIQVKVEAIQENE